MLRKFKGILFSPTTELCYKFVGDTLYRLPLYSAIVTGETKHKPVPRIWTISDYKDESGRSSTWIPLSEKLIEKYKIDKELLKC